MIVLGFDDKSKLTIAAVNVPFWSLDDDFKDIIDERFKMLAYVFLTENIYEEVAG